VNVLIARIVVFLLAMVSVVALPLGVLAGYFALGSAPPSVVFYTWGGIVAAFLFFWVIGVMSELEQVELLSLDKFLYLPVSPAGAFMVNYAGSSFGLALVLFVPGILGLSVGMLLARGLGMLPLFPLCFAFFLMVTAVTYQFQGWLASMMANPRRRQTVLAIVTLGFVLVFFLPQFVARDRERGAPDARAVNGDTAPAEEVNAGNGTDVPVDVAAGGESGETKGIDGSARFWSMVLPPGWLPLGAGSAADGRLWPSLAGALGMALIGAFSLKRAYRTTIRRYTGAFNSGAGKPGSSVVVPSSRRRTWILEARLPGLPERASAVATATFRSFARAPELKMMLLSPIFVLLLFGEALGRMAAPESGFMGPVTAFSAAALMLSMGMTGFLGNMFAFDRDGFRAFMLGPAARGDVLLGKNLAMAPFAFALMTLAIAASQWFRPMRPDHLLAVFVSTVPMYLLFCLAGNALSILVPIAVKRGSGWPTRNQGIKPFVQVLIMFALPGVFALTLWPLGVEYLASVSLDLPAFPIFAVLGIMQAGGSWVLYRWVLAAEGDWLYRREHRILDAVARQSE
jgi:hypothetical protein